MLACLQGASWAPLLARVAKDTRTFPEREAMLAEHHRAVRVGGSAIALALATTFGGVAAALALLVSKITAVLAPVVVGLLRAS